MKMILCDAYYIHKSILNLISQHLELGISVCVGFGQCQQTEMTLCWYAYSKGRQYFNCMTCAILNCLLSL